MKSMSEAAIPNWAMRHLCLSGLPVWRYVALHVLAAELHHAIQMGGS